MFKKDTDSSLETIRNVILRLARHHRLNQRKYKIHVCKEEYVSLLRINAQQLIDGLHSLCRFQ